MIDPELQKVWHDLNAAQVAVINAADSGEELTIDEYRQLLADAQTHTKLADVRLKQLLVQRTPRYQLDRSTIIDI